MGTTRDRFRELLRSLRHPIYESQVDLDSGVVASRLEELLVSFAQTASPDNPEAVDKLLEGVIEAVQVQHGRIFTGTSRRRRENEAFDEVVSREYRGRFRDHGAVHLELGTYTAFQDDRVRRIVELDGLSEFIRSDFDPGYNPDVVADATRLPFRDESIDRIASNSLFEHIAYPEASIRESFRVLRPGGALRITTLFTYPLHGYPNDYLRYTHSYFERICSLAGFDQVVADRVTTSGPFYTIHNLLKGCQIDPALDEDQKALPMLLHSFALVLLCSLASLDDCFKGKGEHIYKSIDVIAFKPGPHLPRTDRVDTPDFTDRNLSLFQCPKTGLPLERQGDTLTTVGGDVSYPIVDGVPIFVAEEERI